MYGGSCLDAGPGLQRCRGPVLRIRQGTKGLGLLHLLTVANHTEASVLTKLKLRSTSAIDSGLRDARDLLAPITHSCDYLIS